MWWLALAAFAVETDTRPAVEVEQVHAGQRWRLADGVLTLDGQVLAQDVIEAPAFAVGAVAVVRVVQPPVGTELLLFQDRGAGWQVSVPVGLADRPDRVALSPDGAQLAWVSGRTGFASVWVEDLRTGARRQLTNVGVQRAKGGGPPAGFVPPPHQGPPAFDGPWLRWTTPEGPAQVRWR